MSHVVEKVGGSLTRELQSVSFVSLCANLTCLTAKYRRLPGAEGGGKVAWGLLVCKSELTNHRGSRGCTELARWVQLPSMRAEVLTIFLSRTTLLLL